LDKSSQSFVIMANHKSALKRARQTITRTEVRRARVSRIKTFIRRVEDAVLAGDAAAAHQAFLLAQPEIHRGVTKGVLHKNTAARRISGLHARVSALSA
jgi:small subunit ribosomal protein S20